MPRGLRRLLYLVLFCPLSKGLQVQQPGVRQFFFVCSARMNKYQSNKLTFTNRSTEDHLSLALYFLLYRPCWDMQKEINFLFIVDL